MSGASFTEFIPVDHTFPGFNTPEMKDRLQKWLQQVSFLESFQDTAGQPCVRLKKFHEESQPLIIPKKAANVVCGDALEQDIVWLEPKMVWEVQVADLSLSDTHKGALGRVNAGRGIGLRFPRLLRARDDKAADQATTSDQVLELYLNQDSVKGTAQVDDDDDDGYL